MPAKREMWVSATGRAFEDWAMAAADEAEAHVASLLPDSCVQRADLARDIARDIFIRREERTLQAWAALLEILRSEPASDTANVIEMAKAKRGRWWRSADQSDPQTEG